MTFSIEVRYATPGDADGIAALYDRVYHGGYPNIECRDTAIIRRIAASGDHIWVLALDGETVVGACAARPEHVNQGYEVCMAAVHPGYRGRANITAVLDRCLQTALERADCEIVYGYARSELARRVFCQARLSWSWTGTDGGMHLVAGEREEHVFGMAFNPECRVTRIVPPRSVLAEGSPVAREISALNLVILPGGYPARIAVGGADEFTYESDCGRVSFSVFESSHAAVVSAVEGDTPDEMQRVLSEVMDYGAPSRIEHMTLHVLADKLPIIAALCRADAGNSTRRFAVRGYLPGWHKDGDLRFDCVTLVAYTDQKIPKRFGLDGCIDAVYRSFPPAFI